MVGDPPGDSLEHVRQGLHVGAAALGHIGPAAATLAAAFTTAGESHGRALTALLEGIPAGLDLDVSRDVDPELRRRQGGYGGNLLCHAGGGRVALANEITSRVKILLYDQMVGKEPTFDTIH